jgi:hypothetical protein
MIEKVIAAAVEPLVDDIVRLEKQVAALQLTPGPQGAPGQDADPDLVAQRLAANDAFVGKLLGAPGRDGANGADGAGIAAPQWEPGAVYREGSVVVANLGQHFVAKRDTASPTDDEAHWERIGSWGFRHRGAFDADARYLDGDLYVKDYGTFCVVRGTPVLLAGRGALGKPGERGPHGAPGRDGRDGGTIIGAQVQGFKLVLVQQDADGAIDHIEADFGPAIREVLRDALAELRSELMTGHLPPLPDPQNRKPLPPPRQP